MDEPTQVARPAAPSRDSREADSGRTHRLDLWLTTLVARAGSDLLLVPGAPPCMRLEGAVQSIEAETLEGPEIEAAVLPALTPRALEQYRETHIGDSAYSLAGLGRFRINLHHERGRAAAAIRALPSRVPSLRRPSSSGRRRIAFPLGTGTGADRRSGGIGQDHDARGPDRSDQSPRTPPYCHHRRSDRIRARASAQLGRAGGNRQSMPRTFRPLCGPRCVRRRTRSW